MSFVITRPEALATAAGHLSGVGSRLTATQFSAHAALYQAVSAQETTVHEMFTSILGATATSYAVVETGETIAAV